MERITAMMNLKKGFRLNLKIQQFLLNTFQAGRMEDRKIGLVRSSWISERTHHNYDMYSRVRDN